MSGAPTREAAAGVVLGQIAGDMLSIVALANEALLQDPAPQAATLDALASMAAIVGHLADRAARTLNDGHGLQAADKWLCAPLVRSALQALEGEAPTSETAAAAVLRVIDKATPPERTDEAATLGKLRLLTADQLDAIERLMDAMAAREVSR